MLTAGEPLSIDSPVTRVSALAWGPRDAPVALALHGWLDNAMSFCGIGPLLTRTRLIALDLPGHGLSGHRPPGYRYHFIDYIADLVAVADQLGLRQFDLIGHSLGAAVTSMTAAVCADRVQRLVLIEGLGPTAREAEQSVTTHRKAMAELSDLWRPRVLRRFTNLESAVKARMMAGKIEYHGARAIVERNLRAVGGNGFEWRTDPRLRMPTPIYLTEAQVHSHLARVSAKTLLIYAEPISEPMASRMQARAEQVPSIEIVPIAGAHHLHLDSPIPVAEAINKFLEK